MTTTSTGPTDAPAVTSPAGAPGGGRVVLAAAGLAARLLERGVPGLRSGDGLARAVAVEAAARTGLPRDGDPAPVLVATALACREHLLAHPGRVPVPAGLLPGDVFDEDVRGSDLLEEELWGDGVPLGELAAVVGTVRRPVRLVALLVLGGGLSTGAAAQLLGRPPDEVAADLRHLGHRWTDRRRLGLDPECRAAPPLPDALLDAPAATPAGSVIDALAAGAPVIDVEAALATVAERARRRHRGKVASLAVAAALAVAVPAAVLLAGREPAPDRVEAAAPSTTEATTTTVPPSAAPVPVETVPVATTTTAAPTTTTTAAPTTTVAPTTTAPANRPLQATLEVLTPTVEAGRTATARLTWSDPDLADADLRVVDIWGDPELFYAFSSDARPACDAPGAGGSGTRDLRFRYATPGTYTLSVVVTSCDGTGAFGERVQLSGRVEVTAPVVGGAAGRAVVAAATDPTVVSESATATFTPDGGTPQVLEAREPALPLNWSGAGGAGAPTVLRLPDGVRGELRLAGNGSCRRGTVDLTAPAPVVVRAVLDQPC